MENKKEQLETPSVFVGKFGYPNISVGFLNTKKDNHHDNPRFWAKHNYSIPNVLQLRKELIHTPFQTSVTERFDSRIELAKTIAMAQKSADVQITYELLKSEKLKSQGEAIPYGPTAKLQSIQAVENIKTDKRMEQLFHDIDSSAKTAIHELYKKGVDEHHISKLLSVGCLGRGRTRKLVPTRWSITATDDTLSQTLQEKIIGTDTHPFTSFSADYLGNHFLILFFEGPFMFHFIEILPDKTLKDDFELTLGRTKYAQNTAGGYYAARVAILEHLALKKRTASVVCIRFITDEYYLSLGVWVVREAVKKTLLEKPLEFSDSQLLKVYIEKFCQKKHSVSLKNILDTSPVLEVLQNQKSLFDF